jgi:hypothetical protein
MVPTVSKVTLGVMERDMERRYGEMAMGMTPSGIDEGY